MYQLRKPSCCLQTHTIETKLENITWRLLPFCQRLNPWSAWTEYWSVEIFPRVHPQYSVGQTLYTAMKMITVSVLFCGCSRDELLLYIDNIASFCPTFWSNYRVNCILRIFILMIKLTNLYEHILLHKKMSWLTPTFCAALKQGCHTKLLSFCPHFCHFRTFCAF